MKIIAFILAVLVLALSCVPCMDEDTYAMNDNKGNAFIEKSSQERKHTDSDNCSPFCTCNCCTGFTVTFNCSQAVPPVLVKTEKAAIHLPSKITNIALPIWQPPQLG